MIICYQKFKEKNAATIGMNKAICYSDVATPKGWWNVDDVMTFLVWISMN